MKLAQDFLIEIPVLRFSDRLTRARQILRDDRFREVYVADEKGRLVGYIDITDTLRLTATKSAVTVEGFVKDAAEAGREESLEKVARAIRDANTDSAAVIDGERQVVGSVLLSDIFPVILSRKEIRGTVGDYMAGNVVTAKATDTVRHIIALMLERGFTAYPVVNRGKLVGIISRRDLIAGGRIRTALTHAEKTPVASVMKTTVITTKPDEPIDTAAQLLISHDLGRLPVVENGKLVGILGRHDVLSGT